MYVSLCLCIFKQKTAYDMRISDWSSDVCSSDLLLELGAEEQELLVPSRRGVDVDGRVDPALGEAAIEAQLHVAGALELLEDHLVHAAPGLDESGGEDGEAAALLDVAGGADELLGRVERRSEEHTSEPQSLMR